MTEKNTISLVGLDIKDLTHICNLLSLAKVNKIDDPASLTVCKSALNLQPELTNRASLIMLKLRTNRESEARKLARESTYPEEIITSLLAITFTPDMQQYIEESEQSILDHNRNWKRNLARTELRHSAYRRNNNF